MDQITIGIYLLLAGLIAMFVGLALWSQRNTSAKDNPRQSSWAVITALLFMFAVIGSSVYAVQYPQSFLGGIYAAVGIAGVHNVIRLGAVSAFLVFLFTRFLWSKLKTRA